MEIKSSTQEKNTREGKESWTLRETYDNGESKTVTIREVQNGFIISIEHYTPGNESKDQPSQSKWENTEYISATNPLDKSEKKENKSDKNVSTTDIAKSISSFMGTMSNKIMI
jgi:hypothetical protein